TIVGLDAPRPVSEELHLVDTLQADDAPPVLEGMIHRDLLDHLQGLLASLKPRLRTILRLRYGLEGEPQRTLGEIGDALRLSKERIRQLEGEAMSLLQAKMRRLLAGGRAARATPARATRQAIQRGQP